MSKNALFEIGLEELPARFIDDAETQLIVKTKKWLDGLRISYDAIFTFSTPRRLAVLINGIAAEQTTIKEEVRGPSVQIAKDAEGSWTKAAIGFTKGQGKTVDDIYTKDVKGSTYIFVEKHIEGKPTFELLTDFKEIIATIQFKETMNWGSGSFRYARPIRWVVALYDQDIIPFEIANVKTSNITYGHRFLGGKIILKSPLEYQEKLRDNFVIADKVEREQLILDGIKQVELQEGFQVTIEQDLLNEVRNLVEFPTVFCGSYNQSFLELPSEVLIISMKEHQRYFPVKSNDGKLLPYFVGVRNGDENALETVIKGNEKVLHARLSDAEFFYAEDQKRSIDFNLEKLSRVVFQEKLGTISEKVTRVTHITKELAELLNFDEKTIRQAVRAAEISKFDLMTNMVNEFTELQGIMGEKYAIHYDEDKAVAKAIREHYLPNQASGKLPESLIGAVVSVADKLDTIVGFMSVGLTPSGSQDPYSLRRQALAILRITEDRKWDIQIETMIEIAQKHYTNLNIKEDDRLELSSKIQSFFKLRATYLLKGADIEQDVIESVFYKKIGIFHYTAAKASVLSEKRNDKEFKDIEEALVRTLNLAKTEEIIEVNTSLFQTASEELLFNKYELIAKEYKEITKKQQAVEALAKLSELAVPIHSFFEENMVMAEDERLRNNRIALVNKIANLVRDFAELSVIQWKQQQ